METTLEILIPLSPPCLITTAFLLHTSSTSRTKLKQSVFVSQAIDSEGPEEYLISGIHEEFSESKYLTFLSSEPVSRVLFVIMTQEMIGYTNLNKILNCHH